MSPERQRLDKWLWFARMVKTRSLAAALVSAGHVRVNGERCETPAKGVKPGDVLTIALEHQVKVLKLRAAGTRRGPYEEARLLYEDLTPPALPAEPAPAQRDSGSARPTKKDRRLIDAFTGDEP